jgi:hypothetical protein
MEVAMRGQARPGLIGMLLLGTLTSVLHAAAAGPGWQPAGQLSAGRYAATGLRLPDGRVLIAGGYSFELGRTHSSSDLFDPKTGRWSPGPRLFLDRNFGELLPLPEGRLLIAAGFRNRSGTTATTERLQLDPLRFVSGTPLYMERELFSATRLAGGRVLLTGGYSTLRQRTLDTAELYDPKTDQFVPTAGSLRHARFGHSGVLLPDGRVLLAGGKRIEGDEPVLPAELFDPATGQFTETGALAVGRDRCTAWLLPGTPARVLVAGGSTKDGGTAPARRCELYDLQSGAFKPGATLLRDRMAHTATALPDGCVLLVGGWSTSENRTTSQAEVWSPKTGEFSDAGTLQHGRHDHAAVLLADGRVLVAGGKEAPAREGIESPLAAEIWNP